MGKIGLCRAGETSMLLTAKNTVNAGVGETVLVGLIGSLFSFRRLRRLDDTHMMVANKIITDNIFTGEVKSEEERWYPKYIGD